MAKTPSRQDNQGGEPPAPPNLEGNDPPASVDRDRVAQRAYELYLQRGGAEGQDLDDWLSAEQELKSRPQPHGRVSEGPDRGEDER